MSDGNQYQVKMCNKIYEEFYALRFVEHQAINNLSLVLIDSLLIALTL